MLNPNVGDYVEIARTRGAVQVGAREGSGLQLGSLGFESSFHAALPSDAPAYVIAKRCLDILVAGTALIVLLPLLLAAALLVRAQGPGPIIYRQERIGLRGRRFSMFKFRSMLPDRRGRRESIEFDERRLSFKTETDPRVTAIGRFLRTTSLDELPQILNVLKGDMSLVGPRPEQPEMLRYYRPEHYQRHIVLPGLTGWWQVHGRCNRPARIVPQEDIDTKLRDDLYYISRRSFWFDFQILMKTIMVVACRQGAI